LETFETFHARAHPALCRFARTLTGDADVSEDIVSDVFVAAFERWQVIGKAREPEAYLRRMLVNRYIDQYRRKDRWTRLIPHVAVPVVDERDATAQVDERAAVAARLAHLPARQRAVIAMRFYLDMTDEQIAADLGCSPATVRSHASRALRALRILDDGVPSRSDPDLPEESESKHGNRA
jgi:RNA polymerase sigma-70 factor (sigma-E family)